MSAHARAVRGREPRVIGELGCTSADLAPGDQRAKDFDWSGLHCHRIDSPDHPWFAHAYDRLWREFGGRGEMERREVIVDRLAWHPAKRIGRHALLYEMIAVTAGDSLVAVRDHSAILDGDSGTVFVHLSHVVVERARRGGGLGSWLRALPLGTARRCAAAVGMAAPGEITLVAEMEHPTADDAATSARLRSYERAGFHAVDPQVVPYRQPDFRAPAAIAASAFRPLPLVLIVRRVGRELEHTIGRDEVDAMVAALYAMYGMHIEAVHMDRLWHDLQRSLPRATDVNLCPPTSLPAAE